MTYVSWQERRGEALRAFFETVCNPLVYLRGIPANGPYTQSQGLGEFTCPHQAVDVGTLETCLGLDFGAAENSPFWLKGNVLLDHEEDSLTFNSSLWTL